MSAKFQPNWTSFRLKALATEEVVKRKSRNIHEMLDLFCLRRKNLESIGTKENESLHIVSQLLPLGVCQISWKSDNFQRKRACEEKKWSKQNTQTSRDARPFRIPIIKYWAKGNVGSWDFTGSLLNYLHYVCAKLHPNRTNFRVKRLASKKSQNKTIKIHEMLDLLCFQWQNLESRRAQENETLHVANQLLPICVPIFIQIQQLLG